MESNSSATPRAALIWTGYLRESCSNHVTFDRLTEQADFCRHAFDGACDVFIHTWSRLDKPKQYGERLKFRQCMNDCWMQRFAANTSTWPCMARIVERVNPTAVAIEEQDLQTTSYASAEDENGTSTLPDEWRHYLPMIPEETSLMAVKNFAMNTASMAGGVRLMLQHSRHMRVEYAAAVRMRADYGGLNTGGFRDQFMTTLAQWKSFRHKVRHHNNHLQSYGDASTVRANGELCMCDRPRMKRMDFCFWSAPAAPLVGAVLAMEEELIGPNLIKCREYLNHTLKLPVWFSESVVLCAMRSAGVGPATTGASCVPSLKELAE